MPTILLVDDSPVARHALVTRLRAEGLDAQEAASVADGRAIDPWSVACAIVDVDLPDGSGVDLAVALRAVHPALPVAFFTASAGEAATASALGPVFAKPDLDALVAWARAAAGLP